MLALLLAACAAESLDAGLAGDISLPDLGETARVEILSAHGLAQDGQLIAYLSSAPDVTCDQAVAHLTPGDNTDDPTAIFRDGHCNIFLSLQSWDEGFAATDDPLAMAGMSITCTLGAGDFVFEERDVGDEDYYWSGRYWQGSADAYDIAFSDAEAGYGFEMDMTAFSGSLIYESLEEIAGEGAVSGAQAIEECADFSGLHAVY
jgi:hypothetical protein